MGLCLFSMLYWIMNGALKLVGQPLSLSLGVNVYSNSLCVDVCSSNTVWFYDIEHTISGAYRKFTDDKPGLHNSVRMGTTQWYCKL